MKRKKLTVQEWGISIFVAVTVVGVFYYVGGFPGFSLRSPVSSSVPSGGSDFSASVDGFRDFSTPVSGTEGLRTEDLTLGEGAEASEGARLSVHYAGYLSDGTMFDNSFARGEPIQFVLGKGEVISGWEQGFSGMREGGRRVIVIPPTLGYGDAAVGPIPPNSTLVFEVVLLNVEALSN